MSSGGGECGGAAGSLPLSGPAMSSQAAPLTGAPAPTLRAEFGATMALAWPLPAANLLQMMVHAIDVIFVARLGVASIAPRSDERRVGRACVSTCQSSWPLYL